MALPELEITTSSRLDGNTEYITYDAAQGFLDATYRESTGWFGIANVDVYPDYRRNGFGKALLKHAFDEAISKDARLIYASIISRECIDAMVSVFGADAVLVAEMGTYAPHNQSDHYDASANLIYKISH